MSSSVVQVHVVVYTMHTSLNTWISYIKYGTVVMCCAQAGDACLVDNVIVGWNPSFVAGMHNWTAMHELNQQQSQYCCAGYGCGTRL